MKNIIRNAKRGLEKKLANEKYHNSKPFNSYIKKKTTTRTTIGPITNKQGNTVSEETEMAEELNSYFASVFTTEELSNIPVPQTMRPYLTLPYQW